MRTNTISKKKVTTKTAPDAAMSDALNAEIERAQAAEKALDAAMRSGFDELDGAIRAIEKAVVEFQHVICSSGSSTDEELEAVADPLREAMILARIARELAFPDAEAKS